MKQRIEVEQLNELTDEQKNRLREWWSPKRGDMFFYPARQLMLLAEAVSDEGIESSDDLISKQECLPLLSIGQMIEFLAGDNPEKLEMNFIDYHFEIWTAAELCDRLWEEVKIILEGRHPRPHLTVLEDGQSRSTYLSSLIKNVKHRK